MLNPQDDAERTAKLLALDLNIATLLGTVKRAVEYGKAVDEAVLAAQVASQIVIHALEQKNEPETPH